VIAIFVGLQIGLSNVSTGEQLQLLAAGKQIRERVVAVHPGW